MAFLLPILEGVGSGLLGSAVGGNHAARHKIRTRGGSHLDDAFATKVGQFWATFNSG
jgi:hypothetical protein